VVRPAAFVLIPLSRAEHQRIERKRLADLFERSEFPRDPFDAMTRRTKRDTGVFFWLLFFDKTVKSLVEFG
jgi:hypothetical protein